MPCYDPRDKMTYGEGYEDGLKVRADHNPGDVRQIAILTNRIKYLEACLCAILTESSSEAIATASRRGKVDIMSFWNEHISSDESRISKKFHEEFSEHEQQLIKRFLLGRNNAC